jgi:hypothetical protein
MPPTTTQPTDADVEEVLQTMRAVSVKPGTMWGTSLVDFSVHRHPQMGGEIGRIGLAPRASATPLYLGDFRERADCLAPLGKHRTGPSASTFRASIR